MKHLTRVFVLVITAMLAYSCAYDDSEIRKEIDLIKTDITGLKKETTAIKEIVDALNKGKYISAVEEQTGKNSYKITFSDGKTIEVKDGKAVPVIGVKEEDGNYYWTITTDGKTDFLLDNNGDKLPVSGKQGEAGKPGQPGNDGKTPELGIDAEGYWTVNGKRIIDANNKEVKAEGEGFIKEILEEDEEVIFILADDTEIKIPKLPDTHLYFTEAADNPIFVFKPGEQKRMRIAYSNIVKMQITNIPDGWEVNLHKPDKYVNVKAPSSNMTLGRKEVVLRGWDKKGRVFEAVAVVSVSDPKVGYGDKLSTLILNEGNMTTDNGSLIYISPDGQVINNIYSLINGKELGNVTQDLFIKDGKMWIISQNGGTNAMGNAFQNEGMLVKVDLKTMKKEVAFDNELKDEKGKYKLGWPTHLAVLNDKNIFIRDNSGVSHFDSTTGKLTLIEGTSGAEKNRMAVANNKVFVIKKKDLFVFEADKMEIVKTITFSANVTGIEKSKDDNIWVAVESKPGKFIKLDSKTYKTIQENEVTEGGLSRGWTSTPAFSAKGDTLYYNNGGFTIYRHIFSQKATKMMVNTKDYVENANIVYNAIGVHPITGDVYINTIKGFGWDFVTNEISVFNFDNPDSSVSPYKTGYKNYTRFPAGIFFPANFN
ncbi:PL29 family lyase N-terminal domain-containing protein [Porphyromonadaceae bacterium W3.11]|nr:PL29 family lyase N-terminal domain-containing protein [Porphyromonadaceae bacterium W3.11]